MGAEVIITEIDPLRALEAVMDGYRVMPMSRSRPDRRLLLHRHRQYRNRPREHFKKMKDGAIVANSGHFNVELDLVALKGLSKKIRTIRDFNEEYTLKNGKRIFVLGEGRLVNLAAAEGHPSSVMDMSFANQALVCEYIRNTENSKRQCTTCRKPSTSRSQASS